METPTVVFFKDSHTYWHGNRKLSSVGKYYKKYFPPFDRQYWLTHCTLKEGLGATYKEHKSQFPGYKPDPLDVFPEIMVEMDNSDFFETRRDLQWQWERKANEFCYKGTIFHDQMEQNAYAEGYLINPWDGKGYQVLPLSPSKQYDNQSLMENLFELEDGVYVELLVFNLDLGVAGQIDECYIETINGVRYVDFNDHKTNEKKPPKTSPDRCLPPLNHLYASKHVSYNVQLSCYAYLMELFGFKIRNLAYTFYKDYSTENSERVDCEYLKEDINIIFQKC